MKYSMLLHMRHILLASYNYVVRSSYLISFVDPMLQLVEDNHFVKSSG